MAVGYSLGNRNDVESDIKVIGEDADNVITFSRSLPVVLTRRCQNDCSYCGFNKKDLLNVPYSTIRATKMARGNGAREALYVAGERPDRYPQIRSQLDLWGFESYMDYVYTVCELGFLEGLIPVVELGFVSPQEIRKIKEIAALGKVMLDPVETNNYADFYSASPGKRWEVRAKLLEWMGKLKFPIITGLMVGIGETKVARKAALDYIAQIHKEYGMVHEVLIQNFVPQKGTRMEKVKGPSAKQILDTFELAKSILPDDVSVIVPVDSVDNIDDFMKAGLRDFGRVYEGRPIIKAGPMTEEQLEEIAARHGLTLQQRFPLRRDFIKDGYYSKKLGQVFDNYRYKIKKEEQEKVKESKQVTHGS